jgi:hypothetical protein
MTVVGKMDPAIKTDWIKALRSGEYKQTKEALRKEGGYCCLGVLCDVIIKSKRCDETARWEGPYFTTGTDSDGDLCQADGELPYDLARSLKISSGIESHLIAMNDDQGKNFQEIADYIEEEF